MFPHARHGLYSMSHLARGHNSHQEAVVVVVCLFVCFVPLPFQDRGCRNADSVYRLEADLILG